MTIRAGVVHQCVLILEDIVSEANVRPGFRWNPTVRAERFFVQLLHYNNRRAVWKRKQLPKPTLEEASLAARTYLWKVERTRRLGQGQATAMKPCQPADPRRVNDLSEIF